MRNGKNLPPVVLAALVVLGLFIVGALVYLVGRFFAWAFACFILWAIIKGIRALVKLPRKR